MSSDSERELLVVGGRDITISNPRKVLFPQPGHTKLDLVRYYLAVADGALRAAGGRPHVLVRYPNGIDGDDEVVAREIELGVPRLWKEDLPRVGDRDLAPVHVQELSFGTGCHRRYDYKRGGPPTFLSFSDAVLTRPLTDMAAR